MEIKTIDVVGFKQTLDGMRAPYKSYAKSDTDVSQSDGEDFEIGESDYSLAERLCKAGRNHRKFMRMWYVYAEVTAPRYWWNEADTHRFGLEKNSESTVHTLYKEDVTDSLFEFDFENSPECAVNAVRAAESALRELQICFKEATDPKVKNYYRRLMKQILPESFLQKRFICVNYEALRHMYEERVNHRLPEWNKVFVDWVKTLPYNEFITGEFEDMTE